MSLYLEAAALSDPGRVRGTNEDCLLAQHSSTGNGEALGLFIVADGVGGQKAGEIASRCAVQAIRDDLADLFTGQAATQLLGPRDTPSDPHTAPTIRMSDSTPEMEQRLQAAVRRANQAVLDLHRHIHSAGNAASTVTVALVRGPRAVIANVGDSRAYLMHDDHLSQITKDHSLVASLVASGQIRAQDVFTDPRRGLILRSLGDKDLRTVDIFTQKLVPEDVLLLCSDGLWEMVREPAEIASIVRQSGSAAEACRSLVDAANAAGGEDNVSVVVVRILGDGLKSRTTS